MKYQGQGSKKLRELETMADCRCVQVLTFCVFTQIFLLCVAQNTHMKNVAQNKPCDISSMYSSSNNCSAALNGNTNTNYQTNPPNCIHTTEDDKSPFWWVDLGERVAISMITIYGRTYFIGRMTSVNVSVDGTLIRRFTDVSGWTNYTYNIPVFRGGRVVNITKDCDSNGPWINICEVQVWVCDGGWYEDCTKSCGQCNNNIACDKVDGRCTSCQTGFQPPLCQEPMITTINTSSSVQATVTEYSSYSSTGMSYDNDKETVSVAGLVAGSTIGGAVVFFIIGAIFGWWLRKSRSQQPSARGPSSHGIPMTSDAGTSRSTSRPEDNVMNTSDYTNIGYSTNVYDALKAPDDNNTTAYTSLELHTDVHR